MFDERFARVAAAAAQFEYATDRLVDRCIAVQQIAAPTGHEEARARYVAAHFEALGLSAVRVDDLFNVYGRVGGQAPQAPALLVSAHTDTVFPLSTDLALRREPAINRIYGPGIGDNSAGVASLLTLAEALVSSGPPPVDIWLVANTGEEGLGDLRGMRAAVTALVDRIGAAVVIEGMGLGRIVHRALGSRRFRITVNAPGGHSWSDFGAASAVHTLSLLAADLVRMKPPTRPRTSFNVGRIQGGTSINTIAQEANLELDLRSEETGALALIVDNVKQIVARYQTPTWRKAGVVVTIDPIGDRPAGEIPVEHPLVQAAMAALAAAGLTAQPDLRISSTDANIPLSRAIPAVCVGITEGGDAHRLEEWISTEQLGAGMHHLLLLTWWAAMWLAGEGGSAA